MEQEILPPKPPLNHGERRKKQIDYDRVKQLAARGMNQAQIAMCLGVHPNLISKTKKTEEKMAQALAEGTALGIQHVTAKLFKAIDSGDVRAMIFYLERKAGWIKHSITEHQFSVKLPDDDCTVEEAEAAYAESVRMIEHKPLA